MQEQMRTDAPRPGTKAFGIVAVTVGVLLILFVLPYAVVSSVSDAADQTIHRFHNTAGGIATLILAAALLVLARRPSASPAAIQLLAVGGAVSLIAGVLGGDVVTGLYVVPAVVAGVLVAIDPWRAEALRTGTVHRSLIVLAALTAVPLIAYALTQTGFQRDAMPGDPHAEMHHYSGVAVTALALPATILVAALGARGWRAVAWIGGVGFVVFGLVSLAFAGHVSAPDEGWAWAAVAAGLAAIGAGEVQARRSAPSGAPR